jgi:glycosyltransferase involved in cell wall biosynthesis
MTSVAFLIDPVFSHVPGGTGTYIQELVPALVRQDPGLKISLFHARVSDPRLSRAAWVEDYRVEELADGIRTLYPRWNLVGRPGLPAPLSTLDLVHAPSGVAIPPTAKGQRLVVTVHDLAFLVVPSFFPPKWRGVYRMGLRVAVRRADAIITPSRSTAEDLLSRTKVDPARVHVIPEAAGAPDGGGDPAEVATRLKIPRPYLLFVGTLEPRKNLVRLVRAYRRAATSGIPHALVLAGPLGWRHQSLLREIALAGPGEVVLTGRLSPSDLDAVYRGAAAFVYPPTYEGFGLPVLEAMSRGVPTICSNTSSLPEVSGEAAVGVNPGSVREMAAAIEAVLTDQGLADRLAARGRTRAQRFSWDETARLTLQVYEKTLTR